MSTVIANGHHICVGHEGIAVGVGGAGEGRGLFTFFQHSQNYAERWRCRKTKELTDSIHNTAPSPV